MNHFNFLEDYDSLAAFDPVSVCCFPINFNTAPIRLLFQSFDRYIKTQAP